MLRKSFLAFTLISAFAGSAFAADPPESVKASLLPAKKNGGFAMNGQWLWCSSVIKVGDTFHMFASRWPDGPTGIGAWTSKSECVHATSNDLLGPYEFKEVVLQKRSDNWDNTRVHNVKIVRVPPKGDTAEKFVIIYIDSANETGYAVSNSINGPWTRSEKPIINASNPAPLVRPDGSMYMFCRLRDKTDVNRGVGFTAPSYAGPYTPIKDGENLLPNGGELEDPCLWWANNQYNMVLNDWKGHATGLGKGGAQYFSKDGIAWQLVSKEPVFTKEVKFDDGSTENFRRRERPFVYADENGVALALFTACMPNNGPARIVVQPIKNYVPNNK